MYTICLHNRIKEAAQQLARPEEAVTIHCKILSDPACVEPVDECLLVGTPGPDMTVVWRSPRKPRDAVTAVCFFNRIITKRGPISSIFLHKSGAPWGALQCRATPLHQGVTHTALNYLLS